MNIVYDYASRLVVLLRINQNKNLCRPATQVKFYYINNMFIILRCKIVLEYYNFICVRYKHDDEDDEDDDEISIIVITTIGFPGQMSVEWRKVSHR